MVSILRIFWDKHRDRGFRYQNTQFFGTGLFKRVQKEGAAASKIGVFAPADLLIRASLCLVYRGLNLVRFLPRVSITWVKNDGVGSVKRSVCKGLELVLGYPICDGGKKEWRLP